MVLVIDNAQTNQNAVPAFFIWFAVTGRLSALGVILARGHPLSAFTALMVAWLTTLISFIAAGLFAGAVEAWKQRPTVGDLKRLGQARSFDQMTKNRLFRVLLETVLANLGGIVGMFLGIYIIWQRLGLINPADLLNGIL
jgi:pheromone shutdown protein TraB